MILKLQIIVTEILKKKQTKKTANRCTSQVTCFLVLLGQKIPRKAFKHAK